jgi:predicted phage terminase large subunit-like protein
MSIDLAISQSSSADYTAIAVLGKDKETNNIYILDIYRDKIQFNEIIKSIKYYNDKWKPRVIGIETVQAQAYIVQEMIRTTHLNIKAIRPDRDKITRFQPIQARFENGLVFIEENIIKEYKNELLAFPLGQHDDMVDATAYGYNLLDVPKPKLII